MSATWSQQMKLRISSVTRLALTALGHARDDLKSAEASAKACRDALR
jgi:hypothetical protein